MLKLRLKITCNTVNHGFILVLCMSFPNVEEGLNKTGLEKLIVLGQEKGHKGFSILRCIPK